MNRNTIFAVAVLCTGIVFAPPVAHADDNDDLRQEIHDLKARVAELEARDAARDRQAAALPASSAPTLPATVPAAGSSTPARPVEQRLEAVEQAQAHAPKVSVGLGKGLTVASPDNQYSLTVRAYAQLDDREFTSGRTQGSDTFLVRTARPILEGKITDYLNGRLMWDFGQGNARLLDGYADAHPFAHLWDSGATDASARIGEFKVPVGLERWQSEQDLQFVERGQTTNLVPQRDVGVMAHGTPFNNLLEYEVGLTNGASDLQINTGDTDNAKDGVARLLVRPFNHSDIAPLQNLALGAGGTLGQHHGTTGLTGLTSGYLTTGQRSYFVYTPAAGTPVADGIDWRFNPQLQYTFDSFGLQAEYIREGQRIANGVTVATLDNDAWMASANYVLTGEKAGFDGVTPARNFDPQSGAWGAFEVAARLSRLDIDPGTFPVFANPATQARRASEWTAGGNWYWNPGFKINLDYSHMSFEGGAAAGADRPDEDVVLTRTQFRF